MNTRTMSQVSSLTSFMQCCLMLALALAPSYAQTRNAEWAHYGRDAGGTRYAPLTQIHRNNVSHLKVAWTYHTGAMEVQGRSVNNAAFETTPLLVGGKEEMEVLMGMMDSR